MDVESIVRPSERSQVLTPFFLHKPALLFAQSEPHAEVRQANPMNPHVEVRI
jgi:hypothetical protein